MPYGIDVFKATSLKTDDCRVRGFSTVPNLFRAVVQTYIDFDFQFHPAAIPFLRW